MARKQPQQHQQEREERETPMVWSSLPVIIYAFIARRIVVVPTLFIAWRSEGFFFRWGGEGESHGFQGGNGLKPLLNGRINTNPHRALKEKVIAQ